MSFDQPKFEYNIYDKYTIYDVNKVGYADRRNIASNPGSGELIVDASFMSGAGANLHNLQEIIDYADGLSYTTITIDLDTTYSENNLNLPAGITLQAEDRRTIIINIEDFIQSRYNNTDITGSLIHGAVKGSTSGGMEIYSPLITAADEVYCLDEDGDWNKYKHGNITGHSYIDITHQELALVLDTTVKYYHENTLISADMDTWLSNTVEQTNPYMKCVSNMIISASNLDPVLFIKLTNTYQVGYVYDGSFPPGVTNRGVITITKSGGNFTDCEFWDVDYCENDDGSSPYIDNFQLACGIVDDAYVTYIYFQAAGTSTAFTSTAFQDTSIEKTINAKMMRIFNTHTWTTQEPCAYFGGQQIWRRDPTGDYTYEKTFDFEVKYIDFATKNSFGIAYTDVIYCIASNDDIGICEIWSKDLIDENSVWVLKKRINEPLIYMSSYYKLSDQLFRILLRNTSTDDIYHYINKTFILQNNTVVNAFEINNNMTITDFGTDATGYPFNPRALIEPVNQTAYVKYCDINSYDLPASNGLWKLAANIIRSNTDGLYYRGDQDPTFTGYCYYNLFICGGYAVRLEIKDDDTITFSSAIFEHNTIYSTNGLLLNSVSSQLTLQNLIVDTQSTAFYIKGNYSSITVYNSIINGIVDSDVTVDDTCYENVAPLFKDISNEDFHLMSIAEGYPKDSKAISLSTTGIDSGCYDVTREKLPLLHWDLQEASGTVVYDTGLLDLDGTSSGVVVNQTGVSAGHKCYQFDTATDNIVSDSEIYNSNKMTLSFWIKTTATTGDIIRLDNGTAYYDFNLYLYTGYVRCHLDRFYASTGINVNSNFINDGEWHHIILKVDSENDYALLKVDNVFIGITDSIPQMTLDDGDLIVGDTSSSFIGYIENIILFNYITSDQADANLYNNGDGTLGFDYELDKKTVEFENYKTDIDFKYELPYSEDSFDYEGNYKKVVGEKVKIFNLITNYREYLNTVRELEALTFIEKPIRFYPFNDTGEKFLLYYDSNNVLTYESYGQLSFDFITFKAYSYNDRFFQPHTLKNAYITVTISSVDYYFRIIDNTDQIIELENVNNYTGLSDFNVYYCRIEFYYVKTSLDIEGKNAIWDRDEQGGMSPALKLYTVEEKNS